VLLPAGAPKIVLMIDKRPAANACAVAPDVRVLVDGVELAACSSLALVDLLSTLAVELCAPVLAVIERRLLDGPALDVVLAAEQRLVNWAQAGSAATTCELALAPDRPAFPGQRLSEPDGFAAESIAFALGTSPMAAGYALDFAWFAYRRMPIAWHAWWEGFLTTTKMRIFQDLLVDCAAEVVSLFEAQFLDTVHADRNGRTKLGRAAGDHNGPMRSRGRRLIAKLDPGLAERQRAGRERSPRVVTGGNADGSGYVSATGFAFADVAEMDAYITAMVDELRALGDERSKQLLRVYVFTCLLTGQPVIRTEAPDAEADGQPEGTHAADTDADPGYPSTVDPHRPIRRGPTGRVSPVGIVELVVRAESLDPAGVELGWIGRCGLIPADVVRELVERASRAPTDWCLSVVDASGEVVRHARTHHDPTTAQREFTEARFGTCTFPGCQRRSSRCDLDHRIPWESGGPTCPCNLQPLCRRHHRVKQRPGWQVTADAGAETTWTSPNGRSVISYAARVDSS